MKKLFLILFAVSFIAVSCEKGDPNPNPGPGPSSADRTVLVYMAADNSLSGFASSNIVSMIRGVTENYNLLVYLNSPNSKSKLIKITPDKNGGTIDINNQQVLKTYEDDNAAAVDVMNTVLNDMFALYPAESYGLVLWSHGMGWLPTGSVVRSLSSFSLFGNEVSAFYGDRSQNDPNAPVTKYFGQDEASFMDIAGLVSAFPSGKKFEFILFDACFMSNIETYYEMRNLTTYLISSPAEVLGDGFPYKEVVPLLFEESFSPKKVCEAFMTYYRQPANYATLGISAPSASAAYVVASEIDALAAVMKEINFAMIPELADKASVQAYEKASSHVFYDLGDYIDKRVSVSNPELYAVFANQLKRTVPFEDHTEKLYGNIPTSGFFDVRSSCGVSAYIPGNANFDAAYNKTGWALATRP